MLAVQADLGHVSHMQAPTVTSWPYRQTWDSRRRNIVLDSVGDVRGTVVRDSRGIRTLASLWEKKRRNHERKAPRDERSGAVWLEARRGPFNELA